MAKEANQSNFSKKILPFIKESNLDDFRNKQMKTYKEIERSEKKLTIDIANGKESLETIDDNNARKVLDEAKENTFEAKEAEEKDDI